MNISYATTKKVILCVTDQIISTNNFVMGKVITIRFVKSKKYILNEIRQTLIDIGSW